MAMMASPPPLPSPPQMSPMGPPPAGPFANASLYAGDLDASVDEAQLFELFSQIGPVVSVRICRDLITGASLGYGYVNFQNPQDASRALETLNFTAINKKPIRIMFSNRDPSMRKSGFGNVFIKNLDPVIDNKTLYETFASFGTVLSCKVATDINGQSKGYAFVQFEHEESAQKAISQLNGMLFNGKKVYVGLFIRRQERDRVNGSPKYTNVYVKNLFETITMDDLVEMFKECGPINSAVVMKDKNGNSRGFGFINFNNHDDAARAVEKFNGKVYNEKVLYVGRAQKKAEREAELKAKYVREINGRLQKLQGANLFLKNLEDDCNDDKLKNLFSKFGTITSCKVMVDNLGQSKGYGFVAFSSPEEATRALIEMNGRIIGKKPLYVSMAQRKEERKATLQLVQRNDSPGFRYIQNVRNIVDPAMFSQGPMGPVMPLNVNGMPVVPVEASRSPSLPISTLASALASATPENQHVLLGEKLYPLVERIERDHAGKVTGMLLEMDQTEVLHLIESPEALKQKISEALDALHRVHATGSDTADQLSSLALND